MSTKLQILNSGAQPLSVYAFISAGRPRPETLTLSHIPSSVMALPAAAIPTVVGAMISLRFGCLSTRPRASSYDFSDSSFPYTVSTSSRLAYFESVRASSSASIQAFWFAASGEAERMANSPPSSPRMLSAMSAITVPVSSKSTCATKTLSPSPDGIGESHDTTVAPASVSCFTAGSIWSPALFEIISAFTPCVAALVTISIWPETLLSAVGPRNSGGSVPSSSSASGAPSFVWSKTATPVNFGSRIDLKSWPVSNMTGPPASAVSAVVSAVVSPASSPSSSSPPQAATSATRDTRRASSNQCLFIRSPFLRDYAGCGTFLSRRITSPRWARRRRRRTTLRRRLAETVGNAADEVRYEHRRDQERADDPGLRVGLDVGEPEAVAKVEDDQDGQGDADDRAGAAEDAHAPEQDHRDDVQLETEREVAPHRAQPRREEHAGQARDEPRRRQQDQLRPRDGEARVARHLGAVADHVDRAAERGAVEDDPGDHDPDREEQRGEVEAADERLLPDPVEPLGEAADRAVLHQDSRRPPETDQPGERDDQRREAELRDEQPLDEAGGGAGEERNRHRELEGEAVLVQRGEHACGEGHHRGDREVDFAVDDDERHDHDDDHLLDRELEHVREVDRPEVERRQRDVHEDDGDEDRRQEQLPAPAPETVTHRPPPPARAARPT